MIDLQNLFNQFDWWSLDLFAQGNANSAINLSPHAFYCYFIKKHVNQFIAISYLAIYDRVT